MKPYYEDDLVTLYHGDARETTAWLDADVLCFDPPYGIAWKQGANKRAKSYAHAGIQGDADTDVRDALLALWGDRGPSATFGSWRAGFPPHKQVLVWRKPIDAGVVGSTTGFRLDTELIFLAGPWPKASPRLSSVLTTDGAKSAYLTEHPHSKPVPLMQSLLELTTGVVADPTAGSGATVVAAISLGRRVIAVELEERYCELIAKRAGQQAFDFGAIAMNGGRGPWCSTKHQCHHWFESECSEACDRGEHDGPHGHPGCVDEPQPRSSGSGVHTLPLDGVHTPRVE